MTVTTGCEDCGGRDGSHYPDCHVPCAANKQEVIDRLLADNSLLRRALDDLLADQGVEMDGSYCCQSARTAERLLESMEYRS